MYEKDRSTVPKRRREVGTQQYIVLDDDPTGVQTVHNCLLLTAWNSASLRAGFNDAECFFYVLTNTRARTADETQRIVTEVVQNALKANADYGYRLVFVSRSDSTLRGHFPLEARTVAQVLEEHDYQPVDAVILIPAFFEGGRFTRNGRHYLIDEGREIPTDQTEFAKDSVFGYTTSYLPGYVAEKTRDTEVPVDQEDVVTISLQDLRRGTVKTLVKRLAELSGRSHVAVDAENYQDLNVFTEAVHTVLGKGKRFVFQTAASFVKSVTSNPDQPLQTRFPGRTQRSGLVIVGSHVPKTSAQLEFLLSESNDRTVETEAIEIDVHRLLKDPDRERRRSAETVSSTLRNGRTPVVYTSREVVKFDSQEQQLSAGAQISRTLSGIVSDLDEEPRFIIAKGGITCYDVLVHGLHVREVRVKGQLLPGIPVVVTPEGHRFAGLPYVIFPGNVGDTETLVTALEKLTQTQDAGEG